MARSGPARVQIPGIGVDSTLMALGLQDDGMLEVPPNGFPAGWYTGAPTPGELGPAVIAGHVHWDGRPGVFARVAEVRPDDKITVVRKTGSVAFFRVTRVEQYAKDRFPTDEVYSDLDHAGLRLITCGGLDTQTGSYEDNVVVFADLVAGHDSPGRAPGSRSYSRADTVSEPGRSIAAMEVTDWLFDGDPAIRWQVLLDLTEVPPDQVAAERARVETEGWGARLVENTWHREIVTYRHHLLTGMLVVRGSLARYVVQQQATCSILLN